MRIEFILGCAMAACLALEAAAEPVTVAFSGTIDVVTDPFGELPAGIGPGIPFSGSYTIDPALVVSTPIFAPLIWDHTSAALGAVELDLANHSIGNPIDLIRIGNGTSEGDFWTQIHVATRPDGILLAGVHFFDSTQGRITDASAFFVNTSLLGWDEPLISIDVVDSTAIPFPRRILARGVITVLPEPDPAIGLPWAVWMLGATWRRCAQGSA